MWDKFVFNRSTQKAEKRYYDFKGNIVDKPDYGYNSNSNKGGGNNGQKPSGGEEEGASYGGGGKATPDTRPEFKVRLSVQ